MRELSERSPPCGLTVTECDRRHAGPLPRSRRAATVCAVMNVMKPWSPSNLPRHAARRAMLVLGVLLAGCQGKAAPVDAPAKEQAQPATPTPAPATATPPVALPQGETKHPLLWTVTYKDKTSHLFGTMHLGVSLEDALPKAHRPLLQAARVVVLEADLSAMDPVKAASLARLPADQSLQKLISKEAWAEITGERGLKGFPSAMLDHMQPWVLGPMLLHNHMTLVSHNATPMEQSILLEVPAPRRAYLETANAQLEAISGISQKCNVYMLEETAKDVGNNYKEADQLLAAYREGDTAKLEALVFEPDAEKVCPEVSATLLRARNAAWVAPLEKIFKKGDAFVAVGAAHMLGESGIIALLEKRGAVITRVLQ